MPITFERQLYLCRREIEHRTKDIHGFYMPSFSSRLISYKALAMPAALRAFYLDFEDPDYQVGDRALSPAVFHQHLPRLAARPAVPDDVPQRRNQHRRGQPQLDDLPRGVLRLAGLGR